MGNKHTLNPLIPQINLSQWQEISSSHSRQQETQEPLSIYGDFRTLQKISNHTDGQQQNQDQNNNPQQQVVDEYLVHFSDQQDFKLYLDAFIWRLKEPYIVRTKYLQQNHSQQFCSKTFGAKVYIQNIQTRLSDITDIPFPQNLYVAYCCFEGYHKLYDHLHYFKVQQGQICVDYQGLVRVWLNSDLCKNYPSTTLQNDQNANADETLMVQQILSIIDQNTDKDSQPMNLIEYYQKYINQIFSNNNSKRLGFQDAKIILEEYIKEYNVQMPVCFQSIMEIYRNNNQNHYQHIGNANADPNQNMRNLDFNQIQHDNDQRRLQNMDNYPGRQNYHQNPYQNQQNASGLYQNQYQNVYPHKIQNYGIFIPHENLSAGIPGRAQYYYPNSQITQYNQQSFKSSSPQVVLPLLPINSQNVPIRNLEYYQYKPASVDSRLNYHQNNLPSFAGSVKQQREKSQPSRNNIHPQGNLLFHQMFQHPQYNVQNQQYHKILSPTQLETPQYYSSQHLITIPFPQKVVYNNINPNINNHYISSNPVYRNINMASPNANYMRGENQYVISTSIPSQNQNKISYSSNKNQIYHNSLTNLQNQNVQQNQDNNSYQDNQNKDQVEYYEKDHTNSHNNKNRFKNQNSAIKENPGEQSNYSYPSQQKQKERQYLSQSNNVIKNNLHQNSSNSRNKMVSNVSNISHIQNVTQSHVSSIPSKQQQNIQVSSQSYHNHSNLPFYNHDNNASYQDQKNMNAIQRVNSNETKVKVLAQQQYQQLHRKNSSLKQKDSLTELQQQIDRQGGFKVTGYNSSSASGQNGNLQNSKTSNNQYNSYYNYHINYNGQNAKYKAIYYTLQTSQELDPQIAQDLKRYYSFQ